MPEDTHHWDAGARSGRISQNAILRVLQQGESYVYALLTRHGAIKIGVSKDLAQRKTSIDYGGVERFLAFTPGTYDDEQAIHDAMADDVRIGTRREYYYPVWHEVLPPINQLREAMGVPLLNRRDLPRPGFWGRRLPEPTCETSWLLPYVWREPLLARR